ncbi:hypothetical protein [Streptomyces ardesiacus]|uniref:Uncharacterized protein n=1 Tax=Streptomyces ardesiacus TaxID=285564 RepID=A0ABW8H299_9ACTN
MSTAIPREARTVHYSKGGAGMKDRIAKAAQLGYGVGDLHACQPSGGVIVTAVRTRLVPRGRPPPACLGAPAAGVPFLRTSPVTGRPAG